MDDPNRQCKVHWSSMSKVKHVLFAAGIDIEIWNRKLLVEVVCVMFVGIMNLPCFDASHP